ncbi:hypothetical protein Pcinc_041558, partial [Petrolisthes cinctipes]
MFCQSLERHLNETQPPVDLDQHEEALTNAFHLAADEAIPKTKPHKKLRKDHWFYDQRVRILNNRINAARRLNRRHPTDNSRTLLRKVVQSTRREKKNIQEQKWIEWCQGIDSHTTLSSMWGKLKAVSGNKRATTPSHSNPQQEAEHLALSFAMRSSSTQLPDNTIHTLNSLQPERERAIEQACLAEADTDHPITYRELLNAEKRSQHQLTKTQVSLELLHERCEQLGLKVNLLKTKAMTFGRHPPDEKLSIFGTDIG